MQRTWEQEQLLNRITHQIRQSLDLEVMLSQTVSEIGAVLGTDRVKIYRFDADGHGQVIAEAIQESRLPSLLGLHFPADDIPAHARVMFLATRQRSIVDVAQQQAGVHFAASAADAGAAASDSTQISYQSVDLCHLEYLRAMGVQSSVVLPILQEAELWGLLVSHHAQPRLVNAADLELLQAIVDQLEIGIMQATLVQQVRQQAECESTVNQISSLLHRPVIQFQPALASIVAAMQAIGGRLYLLPTEQNAAELYQTGEQPLLSTPPFTTPPFPTPLEQHPLWQNYLSQTREALPWAVQDLDREPSCRSIVNLFAPTAIRGLLVMALQYNQQTIGCLTIFRSELATERFWAGECHPDERQLRPRQSFEAWRELKVGQTKAWTARDLHLARALSKPLAQAAQQHHLYGQLQALNLSLEQQVVERTAKLQQAIEQQQALAGVVSKIRASLDLNFIFQTTVEAVRQLLRADRVGIFYFDADTGWEQGAFIAEDRAADLPSILGIKVHDHCFSEDYAQQYRQGRIQAFADLETAELSSCHQAALAKFRLRANLVVPLLEGEELWGLLCVHHCQQPHCWSESEIEFVQQIAEQLGVGIQQAMLLNQTQQQSQQITQALQDLQQAQSQLVQTEKMSSLGQLVAGVAHEINNPVNFIYGNLNHAKSYAESLLDLVQLYQQHDPNSPEIQKALAEAEFEFLAADFPKMLSSMRVGAERIRQIVTSLRNFSRLDEAERKQVDLHEGIDSTLLILQHRLKRTGLPSIQVIKNYGSLPLVECYAGQLNQVFMNLLSNAIDALEEAPQQAQAISICTDLLTADAQQDHASDYALIKISDTGSGMPESVRARIFDPFFTTKPIGRGTGLGLSISYQIITERHGGQLSCDSLPGQGTTFEIKLPISAS